MKYLAIVLLSLTFGIFMFSCKKEKETEKSIPPVTYPNYSKFNVGSYWIYQQFKVDSLGNAIPTNVFDSCFVEKDTLINGQSYVKTYWPTQFWPHYPFIIVRDSLHYIVSSNGAILFSSQDFHTVFSMDYSIIPDFDTLYQVITKMEDKDISVVTPAGTFVTSDYRKTFNYYPGLDFNGKHRIMHKRYAENVGVITETLLFYTSDPTYTERRLVRYHIN